MHLHLLQVKAGHMVMSVDCTHLLNLRHVEDRDNAWLTQFPDDTDHEQYSFDQVTTYGLAGAQKENDPQCIVVTYGDGVVAALQVQPSRRACRSTVLALKCACTLPF